MAEFVAFAIENSLHDQKLFFALKNCHDGQKGIIAFM
jgi:hypothetical protein